MTVRPDFGPDYGEERWQPEPGPASLQEDEDLGEREVHEREQEDRELEYLDPEDNEAHAAGQTCERCGRALTARDDARLLPDGHWVHEVCPP